MRPGGRVGVKILFCAFQPFLNSPQNSEYFEYRHIGSTLPELHAAPFGEFFSSWLGGGEVGTRPWWLALLACGGAYWPLALEPSAMTSRHPHYWGHPHCCGHPPAWGGGESRMQLLPMASSPDGLISALVCGHHEDPRRGGAHHNPQRECHTRLWVLAHRCVTCQ